MVASLCLSDPTALCTLSVLSVLSVLPSFRMDVDVRCRFMKVDLLC